MRLLIKKDSTFTTKSPSKKRTRLLYIDILVGLAVIAVLIAIPYVNLIALPVILLVGGLVLLYVYWRQQGKK